jgi:hypothetical protein
MFSTSMEVRLTLERQREIWSLKSELILVDDNDAIRQGVRSSPVIGWQVCSETTDGEDPIPKAKCLKAGT